MRYTDTKFSDAQKLLLRATASKDPKLGPEARAQMAEAMAGPVRKGLDLRATVRSIFTQMTIDEGETVIPLDTWWNQDTTMLRSWVQPKLGHYPVNVIDGAEELYVPTFEIMSNVEWRTKWARYGRFDVVAGATKRMVEEVATQEEYSGWSMLLRATASLPATQLKNYSGTTFRINEANTMLTAAARVLETPDGLTVTTPGAITNLFLSPERMSDIRGWTYTAIGTADSGNPLPLDEATRREIFQGAGLASIWGMVITQLNELGNSKLYNTLFASMHASYQSFAKTFTDASDELVLGLDLRDDMAFVMVIREPFTTEDDPSTLRQGKQTVVGREDIGFAIPDERRIIGLMMGVA